MNSKKRVQISLSWNEPDRPPIQTYLTPEIAGKLRKHFGCEDILSRLQVDFRYVEPVWSGSVRTESDDIFYDVFGTGYRNVRNSSGGLYAEAVHCPLASLKTVDEVEAYAWPRPEDYDYSEIADQCGKFENFAICVGDAGFPDILNGVSRGRGMDQVIIDIATRDEAGLAIIDKRVEWAYGVLRKSLESANGMIDIVCIGEDCGNQNGRMFSEKDFDEVFRPRLQKFIDLAHEFGCKAMMHSCGDTHELMPTFIEMGLDVLDAMQPEPHGMDAETIRAMCAGKLAFCGLISTQDTLPFGTVEQCRAEARHRLDVIAKGGGYIFSPAHCIQPDTPLENVLAIYEEALKARGSTKE